VPKSKIEATLKKIIENTSKANTPISSNTSLGDPNCPHCGGQGYLRADVPVGDPRFGKLEICVCRQRDVSEQVRERLYSLSRLDELKGLTFETFQPRGRKGLPALRAASIESAYQHAVEYSKSLKGWLLLRGSYGCGKTHLAAAIANYAVGMGVPTLFLTVPDLLDMLRAAYNAEDTTFEERFDEIRNASLLILDDFGTQNATPWAEEKLFQIINYRYINMLPLVITSNLSLDDIDRRIHSRLGDASLVQDVFINAPDFRPKQGKTKEPGLVSLDIVKNKTFGNFSLRRDEEGFTRENLQNLEKALRTAQAFAASPHGWLVFMGGFGTGKTHLAAAIANELAELGELPVFVMVPDLLDHLRATFSPSSNITFDRLFNEIRTAPLLVLDDLGTQSMTPWVREKLYQLFNYRYNAELPTVITTSDSLDEMDPRIRSRLLDGSFCSIYAFTVPGYHGTKTKKNRR
jgi:DNA replication protein DnaC